MSEVNRVMTPKTSLRKLWEKNEEKESHFLEPFMPAEEPLKQRRSTGGPPFKKICKSVPVLNKPKKVGIGDQEKMTFNLIKKKSPKEPKAVRDSFIAKSIKKSVKEFKSNKMEPIARPAEREMEVLLIDDFNNFITTKPFNVIVMILQRA